MKEILVFVKTRLPRLFSTKIIQPSENAQFIFTQVWQKLELNQGRTKLIFPKEIIWLMGAPGSGKGTHTNKILAYRGITNGPICMSSLLKTPDCKAAKDAGEMIGDQKILELLLESLLNTNTSDGVVVDGFPRTEIQVDLLECLYQKMHDLRKEFWNTQWRLFFR
jgi:adenylate kinase